MRILVTGGAGFLGSHLTERLLQRGDEVLVVDNFNDYYDPGIKRRNLAAAAEQPGFTLREADIRDQAPLAELFDTGPFDVIVHLAARAGVRASLEEPRLYEQVNCAGRLRPWTRPPTGWSALTICWR